MRQLLRIYVFLYLYCLIFIAVFLLQAAYKKRLMSRAVPLLYSTMKEAKHVLNVPTN
jgi:hypothetical protein